LIRARHDGVEGDVERGDSFGRGGGRF